MFIKDIYECLKKIIIAVIDIGWIEYEYESIYLLGIGPYKTIQINNTI